MLSSSSPPYAFFPFAKPLLSPVLGRIRRHTILSRHDRKMRIACLQFNPKLGQVEDNISRAEALLAEVDTTNLDLLVLPELAFTGSKIPHRHRECCII